MAPKTKRKPAKSNSSANKLARWRLWLQQKSSALAHLAAVVALAIIGFGVLPKIVGDACDHYPIRTVKVTGQFKYFNKSDVETVLEHEMTANYFSVDLFAVREQLGLLPWIESAWVKKEWPDTLLIRISEREPLAHWSNGRLVSKNKELFNNQEPRLALTELPVFIGSDPDAALMVERYQRIKPVLAKVNLAVEKLAIQKNLSWQIELNDGFTLIVDEKDFINKLQRFIALYQKMPAVDRAYIQQADLRYENGLAIKWKNKNGNSDAA